MTDRQHTPADFLNALETLIDTAIEQGHDSQAVIEVLKENGDDGMEYLEEIVEHLYQKKISEKQSPTH